jgi:formylglycine-generating enzyme required for sulfatase activity
MMRRLALLTGCMLALALAGQAFAQGGQNRFRDCETCPEMVTLPGGAFTMGVPAGEEEREGVPQDLRGRSQPLRRITIAPGLAMSRTAITRGQFAAFVESTGHQTGEGCWTFTNTGATYEYEMRPGLTWRAPGFEQDDEHPVVCVNWADAAAYAAWLSRTTGQIYRLPSEAEWEYAARAGTVSSRFWGDSTASACEFANVADLTMANRLNLDRRPQFTFRCNDGHVFTAPVASFRPNAFGLFDMLGNVWQWTADCLNPSLDGVPSDGSPRLSGDCDARPLRGGSWSHVPWHVRAGNRTRGTANERYSFVGIRVVRDR